MKQWMDKTRSKFRTNKSMFVFLVILVIVGIVAGTLFLLMISKDDQAMVQQYLSTFLDHVKQNKLNFLQAFQGSLIGNILFVLGIWLLGISVIGIPIMIFMFFSKAFTLGFALSSMIANYKVKGCLLGFVYVFPHHIFNILLYSFLMAYALSFSIRLIFSLLKKKSLDFKVMMNQYVKVLIICVVGIVATSLMETFLTPVLLKEVLKIIG